MTIVIIGAGAAGMTAAVTAAKRGANVILMDQHVRVGKKLLVTGNGRCNIMNMNPAAGRYFGSGAEYAERLALRYTPDRLLRHWDELGLYCRVEDEGRVYPANGVANAVVDVLRRGINRKKIGLRCSHVAVAIERAENGFTVLYRGAIDAKMAGRISADRVIIATGSRSSVSDNDADGYNLLKKLGIKLTDMNPALVPIKVDKADIRGLKGVRVKARLTLLNNQKTLAESEGELLFGDSYVSGIAAMDMARLVPGAMVSGGRLMLRIDMLPQRSAEEWQSWLMDHSVEGDEAIDILRGLVHPAVAHNILRACDVKTDAPAIYVDWAEIAAMLRSFPLTVTGVESFARSQVTAGGAAVAAFDPDTLECRAIPGLYAIGEALDVDGACGGFNLMWAWASGIAAGEAASE